MTQTVLNILASADTDHIRSATYLGRDYLVVPVVALVEGVLHSANASNPELALAEEFGRYPESWNGRPIVMNHPRVDGTYVSANSPEVLEEYAFGTTFNARMDGSKLVVDAWIDLERVESVGGEIAETVERIQSGDLVEVSTGLYTSVESSPGRYSGVNYSGVWRGVAPDHLAFLSEGMVGACSVEDGCGVPRLNMMRYVSPNQQTHDCGCGCGGTCNQGETPMADDATETSDVNSDLVDLCANLGVNSVPDLEPGLVDQVTARQNKMTARLNMLLPNTLPANMPFENAQTLVRNALREQDEVFAIYAMTSDVVVYEDWYTTDLWQRTYSISDDGSQVTLGSEKTKVNLLTQVVPVANAAGASSSTSEDEDEEDDEEERNRANESASTETPDTGAPVMSNDTNGDVTDSNDADVTSTPAEPQANAAPTVLSADDYIQQAPPEVREVLAESMRLHASKKGALVSSLKANDRCDYSEDELNAMDLRGLERLAKLANVPTYEGAAPSAPTHMNSSTAGAPAPLKVFEAPNSPAAESSAA